MPRQIRIILITLALLTLPATLWLIHWQIATNRQRAATWFYTFSHFHEPEFTRDLLTAALQISAPC